MSNAAGIFKEGVDMLKRIILTVFILVVSSGHAYATCSYDGQMYPEGTVIGPYACSDGQWISG